MNSGAYLWVLAIGSLIVLADCLLILRISPTYLDKVYRNPARSRNVVRLVSLLFCLVMLGVVALVSSVGFAPDAGVRSVIARLGVVLILTALGHGITLTVLSRLREQELATEITEAGVARNRKHGE